MKKFFIIFFMLSSSYSFAQDGKEISPIPQAFEELSILHNYLKDKSLWDQTAVARLQTVSKFIQQARIDSLKENYENKEKVLKMVAQADLVINMIFDFILYLKNSDNWHNIDLEKTSIIMSHIEELQSLL